MTKMLTLAQPTPPRCPTCKKHSIAIHSTSERRWAECGKGHTWDVTAVTWHKS